MLCATASPAAAQRIDELLNPSIAGAGIAPGVTVASRVRPEYEFSGLHLGSFLVRPELTETTGYDDNVTGSSHPHGSPLVETNATLSAASNWSRNSLGVNLSVDDQEYLTQTQQSLTNWTASTAGTYEIGRDVVSLGLTHLNLNQTPRDLDVPQLDHVIAYRIDEARLGYRANFSRTSLEPAIAVTRYNFDNGTVLGQPYIQTYRNRVVVSPSLEARYELAPLRDLVLVVRDAEARYSNRLAGAPSRDFSDVSVLGGVAYDTGSLIRLRLLAGYEVRTFSSNQFKTISAPIVEASAAYSPSGLTTITGSAARYIEDSASEVTSGFTESALKLRVDHEYLRNVLFNAQAGAYFDDYAQSGNLNGSQGGGHQSYYTAGIGSTWLMNRHMRLALSYDFASRQSNTANSLNPIGQNQFLGLGQSQIFGGSYSENRVLLQFKLGL